MVKIQAHTMLPATPQRTADIFCAEPTPTMAPVMVWVVDTGTPKGLASSMIKEPSTKPSSGDRMIHSTVFSRPPPTSAPVPDLATAAPTRPPISACDDDDGMP